jgi:exonuclease SbcD
VDESEASMRILHTADWHIGQTLAGYPRDHEHAKVLGALAFIAEEREADALICAGDVFDHQNPSGEAQQLFYGTLVALRQARPDMPIVIIAGNHDAAGRLEAPNALLAAMGIHIVGNVRRNNGIIDGARHLVPLRSPRGEIWAHVLAVSHPTAACLPGFEGRAPEEGASPIVAATRALYADLLEATRNLWRGLPLIVTGHLHVSGAIESEGSERRILVGGQHAVPADVFPAEATYVALGHLHKAQSVAAERIRYSGSILPLSASEIPYEHCATLITLNNDVAAIEEVPIDRPVPFLRLPAGSGEMRLDDLAARLAALNVPRDLPIEQQPFVQIWLSRDGLQPGYRAEIDRIAAEHPVRLVDPRVARPPEARAAEGDAAPLVRLAELEPEEMFRRAFLRRHDREPGSDHMKAFHFAATAAAART